MQSRASKRQPGSGISYTVALVHVRRYDKPPFWMQASPAASPRRDSSQLRAALGTAQKELADTRAALEAQKLNNSGLQARF